MRLAAVLFVASALLGQDSAARKFAGTWEAKFEGAVFCVLKIQAGDKLAGTMSSGDVNVDEEGNLRAAKASDRESPILRPNVENETLTFELSDDPNEEPVKFEVKLNGKQEAQLRIVNPPEDVKVKPFTLTRRD